MAQSTQGSCFSIYKDEKGNEIELDGVIQGRLMCVRAWRGMSLSVRIGTSHQDKFSKSCEDTIPSPLATLTSSRVVAGGH